MLRNKPDFLQHQSVAATRRVFADFHAVPVLGVIARITQPEVAPVAGDGGVERGGCVPLWLREGAIVPLGDVHQWVGEAPDEAVELVLTPLDADGERRLDFAVNGHAASAVLTRRSGQHSLTVARIPGVTVTPRLVGGVLADVRWETQSEALTAE